MKTFDASKIQKSVDSAKQKAKVDEILVKRTTKRLCTACRQPVLPTHQFEESAAGIWHADCVDGI